MSEWKTASKKNQSSVFLRWYDPDQVPGCDLSPAVRVRVQTGCRPCWDTPNGTTMYISKNDNSIYSAHMLLSSLWLVSREHFIGLIQDSKSRAVSCRPEVASNALPRSWQAHQDHIPPQALTQFSLYKHRAQHLAPMPSFGRMIPRSD